MATIISKAVNLQNDIYSPNRSGISIQKATNPLPRSGNFIGKLGKFAWNNEKWRWKKMESKLVQAYYKTKQDSD